jgi:hypothetical protein
MGGKQTAPVLLLAAMVQHRLQENCPHRPNHPIQKIHVVDIHTVHTVDTVDIVLRSNSCEKHQLREPTGGRPSGRFAGVYPSSKTRS